jgi:hypothetical protein
LTVYKIKIQDSHPLTKFCSLCCQTLTKKHVCFERKASPRELEVKIENPDEVGNIKTEVFEEKNYFEPLQIIGEKRKNTESSNLENKKIKEEFELEKLSDRQEPQDTKEISHDAWNNEVIKIM